MYELEFKIVQVLKGKIWDYFIKLHVHLLSDPSVSLLATDRGDRPPQNNTTTTTAIIKHAESYILLNFCCSKGVIIKCPPK